MSRPRAHDKIPAELDKLLRAHVHMGYLIEVLDSTESALSRSWRAGYSCGHALKRYHARKVKA